jgi:hypothetical protein
LSDTSRIDRILDRLMDVENVSDWIT